MARTKGSKNVVTGTAKENIVAVFNRLEGTAGMAKWARDNLTEFYKLYGRLIPAEQHLSGALGTFSTTPSEPAVTEQRYPLEGADGSPAPGDPAPRH